MGRMDMKKVKPESKTYIKNLYKIEYYLSTNKSMENWLDDFTDWLKSRHEAIGGTIGPVEEREWNE